VEVRDVENFVAPCARHAPEVVYAILLRSAGQALLDLGASRLGARMGVLTVLHSGNRVTDCSWEA
jgi:hypothetical protein